MLCFLSKDFSESLQDYGTLLMDTSHGYFLMALRISKILQYGETL